MSGDPGIYGNPPPIDYSITGICALGQYRIRPTWFGCVLEECWQSEDGSRFWRRATASVPVPFQGRVRHFLPEGTKFEPLAKAEPTS